jgi:hypothetical protein
MPEQLLPLTPTLSPHAGRGRDPCAAWEGEGQPPGGLIPLPQAEAAGEGA